MGVLAVQLFVVWLRCTSRGVRGGCVGGVGDAADRRQLRPQTPDGRAKQHFVAKMMQ